MNCLLRRLSSTLATAMLAILPLSAALAAPTLSITGPATVAPGSSFTMQVSAVDVTDLYGFQFDLVFGSALFAARGVTEGPFLASGGTTFFDGGGIDNTTGVISFVFGTLIGALPGVSGSGVLASFDFDVQGAAYSAGTFRLSNVFAVDSSLNLIDFAGQGAAVSIPEPAALSLSLTALAALGASTRRRREVGIPSSGT